MTRFRVLVLADGGFGNLPFLEGVKELGLDAVPRTGHFMVGMRSDRRLEDGRHLKDARFGEQVTPNRVVVFHNGGALPLEARWEARNAGGGRNILCGGPRDQPLG